MPLPPDKRPIDHHLDLDPRIRLLQLGRDIGVEFGINVSINPDISLPVRGYWTLRIGEGQYIHGVNTPAALAFLDGVQIGAREASRIADIRMAERLQGNN